MSKIAAIDIGLKRIGLALCLQDGIITPQNAILRKNRNQAAKDVASFLKKWEIEILVVGIPKSGQSNKEMKRRVEHFTSLVNFSGKIVYIDEYGSSLEAKERIKGVIKHKKDGRIDSMAALIIIERFLSNK